MWLFGDGMGHYTVAADVAKKWTAYADGVLGGVWSTGAYGRFSRAGLKILCATVTPGYLSEVLAPADPTTAYVGVALQLTGAVTGTSPTPILQLFDATIPQLGLRINLNGSLSIVRGDALLGTVIAASSRTLLLNAWYAVELGVTIDGAAGIYELRVNNEVWAIGSGFNTQATAHASWDEIRVQGPVGGATAEVQLCDFKINDGSGALCSGMLGDLRGDPYRPTVDGTYSAWTPNVGTDHFAMVDDPGADDGDATIVSTPDLTDTDSYAVEPLVNPGALIQAIQLLLAAKGAGQVQPGFRIGGVNHLSGVDLTPLPASYRYLRQNYEVSPATAVAFTEAEFEAAELLVKRTG